MLEVFIFIAVFAVVKSNNFTFNQLWDLQENNDIPHHSTGEQTEKYDESV